MAKRNDPKLRYLQRIGNRFYVRVTIPPTLRHHFNMQTHIRKSLFTSCLEEANNRKWSAVALIKKEFSRLKGLTVNDSLAAKLRAHIRLEESKGNYDQAELIRDFAVEEAEKIERQSNYEKAKRFYDLATTTEDTLDELHEQWLNEAEYIESTKHYHKVAYAEFRSFLGEDILPSHLDDKLVLDFVENVIKPSSKAPGTKKKKLASLSTFWGYLQSKLIVPRNQHNPFKGHKLTNGRTQQDSREEPRPFTDDELITLFSGLPKQRHLGDLMILGLYTGVRLSAICSLTAEDITIEDEALFIHIKKDKTRAGRRTIAVTHEAPVAVLKGRLKGKTKDDSLFPELNAVGPDKRLSNTPSQQFTRYRRRMNIEDGTDFHSFRRTFITLLENLDVDFVRIARYVGHEIPTLAHKTYSGGSSRKTSLEVAKTIRYSEPVETAVREFLRRLKEGS